MNGYNRFYRFYRTLFVLLSGSCVLMIGAEKRHVQKEQGKPVERFTAQQAMHLSEPLCRIVNGRSEPFTMTAEPVQVQARRFWNVLCVDSADHELLNLAWDADTGEISHVSATGWEYRRHAGPLLSAQQASAVGYDWLTAFSSGIPSAHWRPVHRRICNHQQDWYLEYATDGKRAILTLEAHTGAMQYAKIEKERGAHEGH